MTQVLGFSSNQVSGSDGEYGSRLEKLKVAKFKMFLVNDETSCTTLRSWWITTSQMGWDLNNWRVPMSCWFYWAGSKTLCQIDLIVSFPFSTRWWQLTRQDSSDNGAPWPGSTCGWNYIWPSEERPGWRPPRTWRWSRPRSGAGQLEHGAPRRLAGVYLHCPNHENRPHYWKRYVTSFFCCIFMYATWTVCLRFKISLYISLSP